MGVDGQEDEAATLSYTAKDEDEEEEDDGSDGGPRGEEGQEKEVGWGSSARDLLRPSVGGAPFVVNTEKQVEMRRFVVSRNIRLALFFLLLLACCRSVSASSIF